MQKALDILNLENGYNMIELKGVTKQYLYGETVLGGLDMEIKDGEIIAVLGEDGAGKTSLLKVIAGVTDCEGKVLMDGKPIVSKTDTVIMQFDDLAIFKFKNVYNNLAYPLKIRKKSKQEIDEAVKNSAELLGITACLFERAGKASIIEKKRLAIARLFLREAKVLILDSPTAGLNREDAEKLWDDLMPLLIRKKNQGKIIIFSTDDENEALSISDRIVCMHSKMVKQIGTPKEIYKKPQSIWAVESIDKNYNFEKARLCIENENLFLLINRNGYELKMNANVFKGKILDGYIGLDVLIGVHADGFLKKGETEKVEFYVRDKIGYILHTKSGLKIRSNKIEKEVCTVYDLDKAVLFDSKNENSIFK